MLSAHKKLTAAQSSTAVADLAITQSIKVPNHGTLTGTLPTASAGDVFYIDGGWSNLENYGPYRVVEITDPTTWEIQRLDPNTGRWIPESNVSANVVISQGIIDLSAVDPTFMVLANTGVFSLTIDVSPNGFNWVQKQGAISAVGVVELAGNFKWTNVNVGTIGTDIDVGWVFHKTIYS